MLFFRIISADISVNNDASDFFPFVDQPNQDKPSVEVIDEKLLSVYVRIHKNDIIGEHLLETNKYPPINETMMKVPPTLRDWKESGVVRLPKPLDGTWNKSISVTFLGGQ